MNETEKEKTVIRRSIQQLVPIYTILSMLTPRPKPYLRSSRMYLRILYGQTLLME